jgi:UDP-glucose 4-epimerase
MKALVTGGAGYIGSILVAKLIEAGHEVNVLDDLSTGHMESVHTKAKFVEGSILSKADLSNSMENCDVVFHFAAKTLVEESVKNPELYQLVNVAGTKNILEEMKKSEIDKIVFASTCAVYKAKDSPISETDLLGPSSPYGESKLLADRSISEYCKDNNLGGFSFRFFNAAGAFRTKDMGWLEEKHNPETHLIPNLLASSNMHSFKLYGTNWETEDGTCIRDYVHVSDLAEICIDSVLKIRKSKHEIFNLGTSTGISVQKVIDQFEKISGRKLNLEVLERRAGDSKILVSDSRKAEKLLNWSPKSDLPEIIKSILKISN